MARAIAIATNARARGGGMVARTELRRRPETVAHADVTPFDTVCATGAVPHSSASRPIQGTSGSGLRAPGFIFRTFETRSLKPGANEGATGAVLLALPCQ